ncbi:MAG: hypothetical protein R3B70_26325 [Polyangiaceae bacterium]
MAPLLMASGLSGGAYIATASLCAVSMHAGRVLGYGASGLVTRETLVGTLALTGALMTGNLMGKRLRAWLLNEKRARVLELGTLVVCVVLGVLGVGK